MYALTALVVHECVVAGVDGHGDGAHSGDGLLQLGLAVHLDVHEALVVGADGGVVERAVVVLGLVGVGPTRGNKGDSGTLNCLTTRSKCLF